ncbi:isopentenyl-diphosphate delta-isomerase [Tepidamorphus gemmatus]|jgi:isopentenyl-diphosphate delta-isomerase|uniref:isopentenyl-diphosphate Delta-isomerase n=1 Tax=Tepidamorphus gemmatus TaxID=747076 RepID=A0A4R3MJI1_9HYPH|nr:isopentenyl-diphosphate delta-isomerase [Tepidamorphus gemmatus]TCT12584.1 isopentenyl-diphosphate delta-isomerase [Tepidamorphus gemmatus]
MNRISQSPASTGGARPRDADELIEALDATGSPRPIGKLEAHERSIRHRAISVFVFRRGELLLQQRSATKYHSPNLWANTCCSHPRWGEDVEACAARRLREEMGFSLPLTPFGIVEYQAQVGHLYEHEVVHRFHGIVTGSGPDLMPDPDEVQDAAWMSLSDIAADIRDRPGRYAPWFVIYMREHIDVLRMLAHAS